MCLQTFCASEKFKLRISVHVPQRQTWPSAILLNKTDKWQRIAFKVIEIWQLLLVSWQETNWAWFPSFSRCLRGIEDKKAYTIHGDRRINQNVEINAI